MGACAVAMLAVDRYCEGDGGSRDNDTEHLQRSSTICEAVDTQELCNRRGDCKALAFMKVFRIRSWPDRPMLRMLPIMTFPNHNHLSMCLPYAKKKLLLMAIDQDERRKLTSFERPSIPER